MNEGINLVEGFERRETNMTSKLVNVIKIKQTNWINDKTTVELFKKVYLNFINCCLSL
jgi:hypothetical protein